MTRKGRRASEKSAQRRRQAGFREFSSRSGRKKGSRRRLNIVARRGAGTDCRRALRSVCGGRAGEANSDDDQIRKRIGRFPPSSGKPYGATEERGFPPLGHARLRLACDRSAVWTALRSRKRQPHRRKTSTITVRLDLKGGKESPSGGSRAPLEPGGNRSTRASHGRSRARQPARVGDCLRGFRLCGLVPLRAGRRCGVCLGISAPERSRLLTSIN